MSWQTRRRRSYAERQRRRRPAERAWTASIRGCCLTSMREDHLPDCRREPNRCGEKHGYVDRATAAKVALEVSPEYGRVTPYRCRSCRLWHVGHPPSGEPRS